MSPALRVPSTAIAPSASHANTTTRRLTGQSSLRETGPIHSIINQAADSRLRLMGGNLNAGECHLRWSPSNPRASGRVAPNPLSGIKIDGFGLGWYDAYSADDERNTPCIFQAITPAWSNRNLHRLAEKLKSRLVFAHVRASTLGVVSEPNCAFSPLSFYWYATVSGIALVADAGCADPSPAGHPWSLGCLMFMHNGEVAQFAKIKRRLQAFLSDRFFHLPLGSTDSEWCFSLFLQHLSLLADVDANSFSYKVLQQAVLDSIASINKWSEEAGITVPSLLNFCVTDGRSIIATRYITSATDEAASLWFSTGSVGSSALLRNVPPRD